MTAKIYQFPTKAQVEVPKDLGLDAASMAREYCEETTDSIMAMVLSEADNAKLYDLASSFKDHDNDAVLLHSALESFLCRKAGVAHPMHPMVDIILDELKQRTPDAAKL